jgi:hypothetical protein
MYTPCVCVHIRTCAHPHARTDTCTCMHMHTGSYIHIYMKEQGKEDRPVTLPLVAVMLQTVLGVYVTLFYPQGNPGRRPEAQKGHITLSGGSCVLAQPRPESVRLCTEQWGPGEADPFLSKDLRVLVIFRESIH